MGDVVPQAEAHRAPQSAQVGPFPPSASVGATEEKLERKVAAAVACAHVAIC